MRLPGMRAFGAGLLVAGAAALGAAAAGGAPARSVVGAGAGAGAGACAHEGKPALAADPHPHALRVFGIQFLQQPALMATPADYSRAIDCAIRAEVLPYLAKGRPNLVVFDEDAGLETLATGPRAAQARAVLHNGVPSCKGLSFPCSTLVTLSALDTGYAPALTYLRTRFPKLNSELGRAFVAATDTFVNVFMTTMAREAERYRLYVVASNTQAPFAVARKPVPALGGPYVPTAGVAYDQTFLWGPNPVHKTGPAPLRNLLAVNRKVPLTNFETALGFAPGPATGPAAVKNLQPFTIPGTKARLGFATSLPAFAFGPANASPCKNVSLTYMRCLSKLGANVLIQADANDGEWTGADGDEPWQPLSWMGSAYRAVSDPTVKFDYAVNPMMVGNLADTPFDGQSSILERGRKGTACQYIGNGSFVPGYDLPIYKPYAGAKSQFLALAPWVVSGGSRSHLETIGGQLASGTSGYHYVQTAVIADLPFPVDRQRPGCVVAGR
jgi:hypothetical protein